MTRLIGPLEDLYFKWLCSPFDCRHDVSIDMSTLRAMHNTPFEYWVPNDQNRALDGKALREEFLYTNPVKSSPWELDGWRSLECSILEMLTALADRAAYQSGEPMAVWFQEFLENLGLPASDYRTKQALRRLNNRTYNRGGSGGGLFPLRHPLEDQREVEIWYQMAAYIIENHNGEGV